MQKRIEYIDLAKGICIILVVIHHCCAQFSISGAILDVLSSFRMPLYFILSGLFFKDYGNYKTFLVKKTNRLIIPFITFYIFLSIFLPILIDLLIGAFTIQKLRSYCMGWFNESSFNLAIWFLLCLFLVNTLFYLCISITKIINKGREELSILLSILFGFVGCFLAKQSINLPMYLDSSLTALPFFAFGFILKKSSLLRERTSRFHMIVALLCAISLVIPYFLGRTMRLSSNLIYTNPLIMYLCGISGTMLTLMISKTIKHIPFISYIGRYSIMVLLTHYAFIQIFIMAFNKYLFEYKNWGCLITCTITIIVSSALIPFFIKYMPSVTAQKDFIKP